MSNESGAGAVPVRLVLATHNAHKVIELRSLLGDRLDGIELLAYDGPEPIEDGLTFEANALIKARAAFEFTGAPAIADDSGISVAALNGEPGIHSARYAGTRVDADNVALLLQRMTGARDRTAWFSCAAAFVTEGFEHVELAVWPGELLDAVAGDGGFGYDPVFRPDGLSVSAGELSAAEKNAISHRAKAFDQLMSTVRSHLLEDRA